MDNHQKITSYKIVQEVEQNHKRLTITILITALLTLVVGCSDKSDTENAYEKGVWDGAMEVCSETRRISQDVYQQLRRRNVC